MARFALVSRTRRFACVAGSCALAVMVLTSTIIPGLAAGAFDTAAASASTSSGRSLSWSHTLGAGSNRIVVVAVTLSADQNRDPKAVVAFNGVPMLPVPGGVAIDTLPKNKGYFRTQLFYLLEASLPAAGTHGVSISLGESVREIGGGSVSLAGLAQAPPEAVAAGTAPETAAGIATALTILTSGSWTVEAVAADGVSALTPGDPGQLLRYSAHGRGLSIAGSAAVAQEAGTQALAWSSSAPARLAHVVAAFGPIRYPLAVQVIGEGTVEPGSGSHPEGSVVELLARPAPGHRFAGWSGDLSGESNPAALTIDGAKQVTATFERDFGLYGWATANGGTTGGEGGPEVVVDTLAALKFYAEQPVPYIIKIAGTISGNEMVRVGSNKSFLGIGDDARLLGVGLQIGNNADFGQIGNVIIRNITFEKARAPNDGVFVTAGAHNVWIDHCDFFSDRVNHIDFYDGLVDVTNGADFVTVSWSRFYEHFKTSLIGSSDSSTLDPGHLRVTYHDNSFINSGGRNPSVRFGLVHVYNNYYRDLNDYGIASRMGAEVVIEHNWFENVNRPIRADTTLSPVAGLVRGTDTNVFINSPGISITGPPATWVPPYPYRLDPVESVPAVVGSGAGVGIVTFDGEIPPPTAPTITTRPASQSVEVGSTVTFTVVADGTNPFEYQWYKDDVPIADATSSTLVLQNVGLDDGGSYRVEVANVAGSIVSDAAALTVEMPGGGDAAVFLRERFADGERTIQALPDSAAWFSSSGGSNLVATVGELRQIVSSSRTLLTYFTNDQGAPVTIGVGETLAVRFSFRVTAFDSNNDNFRVGLLRSVANPDAVSGTGFLAEGSPNTNARVSGDFGSNGPSNGPFSHYTGYAAMTTITAAGGVASPIGFMARTGTNNTLLGSIAAFTQLSAASPSPSAAMEADTPYRGTLLLTRTSSGISISYTLVRLSDGAVIMSRSGEDPGTTFTAFDTVAFYLSKAASTPTFDFVVTAVDVERIVPTP